METIIGVRRLTPRECERLQGFPDDWTVDNSDTQRSLVVYDGVKIMSSSG